MAINTSLRPRIRPANIDKQMTESLRPKSRKEGLIERRQKEEDRDRQTKGLGDLEYRAELEPQLSWNPIARLGYDPDKHKVLKEPKGTGTAFYTKSPNTFKQLLLSGFKASEADRPKLDDIVTTSNLSVSPIISHEFTHRGFDLLKKERDKDSEVFDKKYGKAAGKILEYIQNRYIEEEYYVELFDDLNTRFNVGVKDSTFKEFEDFPTDTIRDTVQSSYVSPRYRAKEIDDSSRDKRIRQIEEFQKNKLKRRKKGKDPSKEYGSKDLDLDHGIFGLMDAAQDILTEQGEPPKFKKESLNFFQKIGKAIGFDKGGLAEQTDTLFGYTAKGAKQEGERLTTDVNTELTFRDAATFVAEATPIIGDAIAAKEVYDELKKENPNYLLVGALGGAALIGLIPGLGDAAAAGIKKGARSALDTSKRMIPTKKVDDAYNPVIGFGGEDSYDPIVEKYLTPVKPTEKSADEKFALELLKKQAETDPKKSFSTIEDLMVQKDAGLFDNEADLIMAHGKGVLSTPEYFRAKSDFIESKLNSLDPSDPKYKEYEKFSDVYSSIDLATLLDFAREYPVEPNVVGKQYLQYTDDAVKYNKKLIEYADDIGLDPNDFIDVVQDAIPFVGDSVFPDYLPRATDSGDIYPRKATDYTQSNTESLLAKIPTKTDRAASKLGFDDTVYHLAVSEDEFTKFKNVDDLIPEIRDGPTNKFEGTPHDLLGVHVGTARAAAERFRAKSVDLTESPRYTMQLRAKLDKPVRVEDVSEIIGFDPLKLELDDSGLNFTEKDLKTIIKQKAIQKNITGEYVSTTMENQAAIELRKELADSGFTHIPYVNELEDKESISYIMLVDRKKGDPAVLRDYNAKFDPEEAASTDLRMFGGGLTREQ